jgi:hypothetical protein
MNHSGDANKMVSDTPRTDQECGDYDRSGCWKSYIEGECVQSDFARQLERELNEANAKIKRMEREVELFREYSDYGDVGVVDSILRGEEMERKEAKL